MVILPHPHSISLFGMWRKQMNFVEQQIMIHLIRWLLDCSCCSRCLLIEGSQHIPWNLTCSFYYGACFFSSLSPSKYDQKSLITGSRFSITTHTFTLPLQGYCDSPGLGHNLVRRDPDHFFISQDLMPVQHCANWTRWRGNYNYSRCLSKTSACQKEYGK